ncbi:MAG: 4'-phosphopantetheinyl transferase superfamily protein [Bacteroidetes bacterium]|nr:MAG: 4'-phosphopantetheinyl transferase superfamily protein [Bacteroidota bacterium]
MSLFLKKFVQDAAIGIWEINESVDDMYARIKLSEDEEKIFSSLKTPTRKQHWLAYRMILPYLVRDHELSAICYDEYGKPYLNNGVRHISVSHSGKYSALIASPKYTVGIDIERMEEKIKRIEHKFLNESEMFENGKGLSIEQLYIIWAAKETLYKLHGKRDILFREHIYIEPFDVQEQGLIYGTIKTDYDEKIYPVEYQMLDDYILAYALDK